MQSECQHGGVCIPGLGIPVSEGHDAQHSRNFNDRYEEYVKVEVAREFVHAKRQPVVDDRHTAPERNSKPTVGSHWTTMEINNSFHNALNTIRLYSIGHMLKDPSDNKKGNPLQLDKKPLFPIISKGYFISTIPQTE